MRPWKRALYGLRVSVPDPVMVFAVKSHRPALVRSISPPLVSTLIGQVGVTLAANAATIAPPLRTTLFFPLTPNVPVLPETWMEPCHYNRGVRISVVSGKHKGAVARLGQTLRARQHKDRWLWFAHSP